MSGETAAPEEHYTFETADLEPGDILLSRIPMSLHDSATWDSHLIQALTRSSFSFAALYLGEGVFIEGVGSGVARLPIVRAAVKNADNVRIMRVHKRDELKVRRAAAAGSRYLKNGFYIEAAPQTKCGAFHDVHKASVVTSALVASAYAEANINLHATKPASLMFPGDLLESASLTDITSRVLRKSAAQAQTTFYVDDCSLFDRIHHWEVTTQLKVLCNQDIRRMIVMQGAMKPASMSGMEDLIASRRWKALDKAIYRCLKWYRYADIYHTKQNQIFGDFFDPEVVINRSALSLLSRQQISEKMREIQLDFQILKIESQHWRQKIDHYEMLLQSFDAKTFAYFHDLYARQMEIGEKMRRLKDLQRYAYADEARRRGLQLKAAAASS